MSKPKLPVRFFRSGAGREPVREWLKSLGGAERKAIGDDIRTVHDGDAVLLHGFVKKDRKTPKTDLETARKRLKLL